MCIRDRLNCRVTKAEELDEHGKPCQVRACKKAKRLNKAFFASSSAPIAQAPPTECPLDVDELGNATWKLLHTTAAYYPIEPTEEQQQAAIQLINGLAKLYACPHCAPHFRSEVKKNPPTVGSRREFVLWMCEQHNAVNTRLGMKVVKCDFKWLDSRWRTGAGNPACDEDVLGANGEDLDDPA
eukprot:TRINITY_DN30051_c0_g1_i1.p1 TRINITY_DN30051_c0_g1~~TRINITY_DN30051_c0_g1_i1.p1  ORF type:complete len:183 (-),score=41.54 TRINITY_DN30051_c0_g1_i1:9-557(-)